MTKSRLYGIVLTACAGGMMWLWFQYPQSASLAPQDVGLCMIKHITGIPCPSCGTTRSVFALLEGNIMTALTWNPFGLLVAMIMLISPIWIMFDILFRKESFLKWYGHIESQVRTRRIAIPSIMLVLANWAWNILKGL